MIFSGLNCCATRCASCCISVAVAIMGLRCCVAAPSPMIPRLQSALRRLDRRRRRSRLRLLRFGLSKAAFGEIDERKRDARAVGEDGRQLKLGADRGAEAEDWTTHTMVE